MDEKRIVAYVDPWSVVAGDTLDVMVSCHMSGQFKAELVELVSGDSRPHGTGFREVRRASSFEGLHLGREQSLRPGSYAVLPDIPSLTKVSLCLYVYPTLLARDWQPVASGDGLLLDIRDGRLGASLDGGERLVLGEALHLKRWHQVLLSYDSGSGRLSLAMRRFGRGVGERSSEWVSQAITVQGRQLAACDWLLAGCLMAGELTPGFNGRLEAPRLVGDVLSTDVAESLLTSSAVTHVALVGAWDFSQAMESEQIVDLGPGKHHGWTMQMPTRAVTGVHWNGSVQRWLDDPSQYAAIHFHEDDMVDAGWSPDISWTVPQDLPSGVYAVKLTLGGTEEYVPFFVRPSERHRKARVAYLASTATYLAYANQRLGFSGGIFHAKPRNPDDAYLLSHPEVGYSLYEYHADGSGVHFSSRLRPILNMKPKTITWSFNADTNITNWLKALNEPFDVITDDDLHREGADLLEEYRVVITGTHPEYHSTRMLDALTGWLDQGGRLMYMGGNGFYWRIAWHPQNPAIIEVRRAEDGTRAWISEPGEYYHAFTGEYGGLWRRLGRPPNELVGVGFTAQGFDGGTYYRLGPGALDERVAFIMNGVVATEVIGDYGTQGGGAPSEDIDRFDETLGSPPHAICIASSENHRPGMLRVKEEIHMTQPELQGPKVRADIVFFETPAGGAVFSTGSISYAGALAHDDFDNDIARMTNNVLRRFLDETPFDYPA